MTWKKVTYREALKGYFRNLPKGRVVETTIGQTYTYHNFPLTVWALMKSALDRDGMSAGSVYWRNYVRGWSKR